MDRLSHYGLLVARLLMTVVFVLNGFGIIDQTIPAKELVERGAPAALVPLIMWAGRALELARGFHSRWGSSHAFPRWRCLRFLFPRRLCRTHSGWPPAHLHFKASSSISRRTWRSGAACCSSQRNPSTRDAHSSKKKGSIGPGE